MSATIASARTEVPFLDLRPSHAGVKTAILAELAEVIEANAFTNAPQVARFEAAFAEYCEIDHCVGVASGLDALRLALLALEIGPGDEVIVPANTFVATFEAVSQVGATPVPVDASEADLNIDADALAAAASPRTRGVMPVHLYGQLADMRSIVATARRHDLALIEDACQAHGADRNGIRAGTAGHASAFSFYPGKNLGAFGDAGALVTPRSEVADAVRALREHGQRRKYHHDVIGYTARLDAVQAVALLHKLPLLDEWNEARRRVAGLYRESLRDLDELRLPPVPESSNPVWHLFVVRSAQRDELAAFLKERGVATGLHYPQPPHLSPAYASLGRRRGEFPVAERLANEVLSLPMFPGMTDLQVEAVVAGVRAFYGRA